LNLAAQMDEAHIRPRTSTIAGLLISFCCFYASDVERSLLRISCFQKLTGSNPDADSVDGDDQNWWRKGWNRVKRAGEWSESVVDDAGICCHGPKLKYFVRKFKTDGKTIYGSRPSRFQYDPPSYELNFDHGLRQDEDYQVQGLSFSAVKPGESAGALNPRKALNDMQSLQVIRSSRA